LLWRDTSTANVDDVARYYAQAPEEDRLKYGAALLEEARTRELIQRYAPGPPGVVLDVGGGAGAYSFWLADLGYTVHLLDAAPAQPKCSAGLKRPPPQVVSGTRAPQFQIAVIVLSSPTLSPDGGPAVSGARKSSACLAGRLVLRAVIAAGPRHWTASRVSCLRFPVRRIVDRDLRTDNT
jgi:hypothetical protein